MPEWKILITDGLDEKGIENLKRVATVEDRSGISPEELIKILAESKHQFLANQQNSDFFKIERKIEIVKINLNKI